MRDQLKCWEFVRKPSGSGPRCPSYRTSTVPKTSTALEGEYRCDASRDQDNLAQRAGIRAPPVQARDQIRHRDVQEAGGGEREKVRQQLRHDVERRQRRHGPDRAGPADSTLSSMARRRE